MAVIYEEDSGYTKELEGINFIVGKAGLAHWIKFGAVEEKPLFDWATQFMKNGVFVDIGANLGTWSVRMGKKYKVVAFEPQKSVYYKLCGNIAINNLRNVDAYNVALGSVEESGSSKTLTIMSKDKSGSSLDSVKIENEKKVNPDNLLGTETVKMMCLDDYNVSNIDLIKLDVEGYEYSVLTGSVKTLKANGFPKILFEAWHEEFNIENKNRVFMFLESLGYKIIQVNCYKHMFLAEHNVN